MGFDHRRTVTFRLAQAAHAYRVRSGSRLARIELHSGQESLLKALGETDGQSMSDLAADRYRGALQAWAMDDLRLANTVAEGSPMMDLQMERLTETLVTLSGPDAARIALRSLLAGHSLQRMSDHATILGRRIQYLLTGDQAYLAAEVR